MGPRASTRRPQITFEGIPWPTTNDTTWRSSAPAPAATSPASGPGSWASRPWSSSAKSALGGVCLNWGCIPTKALIKNAEMVNFIQRKAPDFGITVEDPGISWEKAVDRSRKVVKRMNRGVAGLLRKNGVDVVQGTARFQDAHTLAVTGPRGRGELGRGRDHVIIATGARSRLLPGMEADGEKRDHQPPRSAARRRARAPAGHGRRRGGHGVRLRLSRLRFQGDGHRDGRAGPAARGSGRPATLVAKAFAKQGIKILTRAPGSRRSTVDRRAA